MVTIKLDSIIYVFIPKYKEKLFQATFTRMIYWFWNDISFNCKMFEGNISPKSIIDQHEIYSTND